MIINNYKLIINNLNLIINNLDSFNWVKKIVKSNL